MKITLILIIILATWGYNLQASVDLKNLNQTMEIMTSKLMEKQKKDGRFEGVFEADPGFELLSLVFLKQNGYYNQIETKAFIEKALKWKTADGFGSYPGGPYNHDVTGAAILSLKYLGYDLKSLKLDTVALNFEKNGGINMLNIGTKMLLAPLGLAQSKILDNVITPTLSIIPDGLPFSNKSLGIFRSLVIPLSAWNFYHHKNNDSKLLVEINSDENSAKKSIQWILDHQMENGTWYTLFHAIVNVSALKEAQRFGVGNYDHQINKAIKAILRWRTVNNFGEIAQQLTLTTGWDTPQTLMALSELPNNIQDKYRNNIEDAIAFLDRHQIKEKGDWAIHSPNLTPGGWSFIVENSDYPDTDVVAAVLEAKLANPDFSSNENFHRGLNWLLNLQNSDGGFPAWEKNVSKFTNFLMRLLLPSLPDYSDLSQTDVTSRITRLLNKLKDKPEFAQYKINDVIKKSCTYIRSDNQMYRGFVIKGRWLIGYLYGTSEALDTLLTTNCIDLTTASQGIKFLVSNQNVDGGFGEDHLSLKSNRVINKTSTVMQTTYIVQSLMAYEETFQKRYQHYSPYKENLDRAINFLIKASKTNNGFIKEKSFIGVIAAGLWYADYGMSPQYMTIRAFGRYSRLINQ